MFKVRIGGKVKEYPVFGFVSAGIGTMTLDISAARDEITENIVASMTGADMKQVAAAEFESSGVNKHHADTVTSCLDLISDEDLETAAKSR